MSLTSKVTIVETNERNRAILFISVTHGNDLFTPFSPVFSFPFPWAVTIKRDKQTFTYNDTDCKWKVNLFEATSMIVRVSNARYERARNACLIRFLYSRFHLLSINILSIHFLFFFFFFPSLRLKQEVQLKFHKNIVDLESPLIVQSLSSLILTRSTL